MTLVENKTYGLLTTPQKPSELANEVLCQILKPLVIVERFRFRKRNKDIGETVNGYVVALQKLSEFCVLGNTFINTLGTD